MTFPKARLAVSAALFLGWLGFLLYLRLSSGTIILSRPQFMIAQLYVVAEVEEDESTGKPKERVTVNEVLWSADASSKPLPASLDLPDLTVCDKAWGYTGPGTYLLPLQRSASGRWQIASVPRERVGGLDAFREVRVYRWTHGVQTQVEAIIEAKK